ncbi:MAG: hypothetical protein JL50_03935 [Peptococcaceae bacterium BICA1-7]|nr:MAG: hypothetical protein JL50_03935 [Peptococcaceae bacterium BICA1-7]HBV97585.1 LysM domain-containing protein [Desulfotomaculum sp.]
MTVKNTGNTTIEDIWNEAGRQAQTGGPVVLSNSLMPSETLWAEVAVALGVKEIDIYPPAGQKVFIGPVTGDRFTVRGLLSLLGFTDCTCDIVIWVTGGAPGFSFQIGRQEEGWTFGDWYYLFRTSSFNRLNQRNVKFSWDSSKPMTGEQSPLSFYGEVELTGTLGFLLRFTTGNTVAWQGPILFSSEWDNRPAFDLKSPLVNPGTGDSFTIGFLNVSSPYLEARATYQDSEEKPAVKLPHTDVNFGMLLNETGMTLKPFTFEVPIMDYSSVLCLTGIYGSPGDTLSLGDVTNWLLNLPAPPSLPAPLDGLFNSVGLSSFQAMFTSGNSFDLLSAAVTVSSKSSEPLWRIYGDDIVLKDIYLLSGVQWIAAGYTYYDNTFGADLKVFGLLFNIEISWATGWPLVIKGELTPSDGLPLKFSDLIQKLSCGLDTSGLDDFFSLTFSRVGAELTPSGDNFALRVMTEADVSLKLFGKEYLGLHNLYLLFTAAKDLKGQIQYSVYASGDITILGFHLPAELVLSGDQKQFTVGPFSFTFGDIVKFMVQLIHPSWDFELPAPWNVLNSIGFENLTLTFDLIEKSVALSTGMRVDFGFIDITDISLTYHWKTPKGQKEGVIVSLKGTFLGLPISTEDGEDSLSWDVVNEHPPEVPGAGNETFHLEYLGIGQHISFRDSSQLKTIGDVITALETNFRPVSRAETPLALAGGLIFNENSGWLLGTKFTFLKMITLSAIFNDPQLYGLRVALAGEKAGSLSGLEFEIFYKKVTDTVGMYHTELILPDAFRYLEFGAVSITLPIVVIDIYTNGNFRIDAGFPHNGNFERSFAVQVFPYIGLGGFYLAYLDGSTSETVPRIDNGQFRPVIEFGFGLAVGLGKTIHKGPLKAGLSLTVAGILEGTLAWFHPDNKDQDTEVYYCICGTVGITGQLYGEVDFCIIKASVEVLAYARVMLIIQSYEPIAIALDIGVEAHVKVKVLFVTIHLSFELTLHEQFTIGERHTPPWHVIEGATPAASGKKLRLQRSRARGLSRLNRMLPAFPLDKIMSEPRLDWQAVTRLKNADDQDSFNVDLEFCVLYTVSDTKSLVGDNGQPAPVKVAALPLLFVPNAIPPGVSDRKALKAADAAESPFSMLAHGMLERALAARMAVTQSIYISLYDLQVIATHLLAGMADEDFTYAGLSDYFKNHMTFRLRLPEKPPAGTEAPSGTIFPMIPDLKLESQDGLVGVHYLDDARLLASPVYEEKLSAYFESFNVRYQNQAEKIGDHNPAGLKSKNAAPAGETTSAFIFRDYFLMITRSVIQAAMDYLQNYIYQTPGDRAVSLFSIAQETASQSGQPGLENPTPYTIALANQDRADLLDTACAPTLSLVLYQTRNGDTVKSIADKFGITPEALTGLTGSSGTLLNAGHPGMLKPGGLISVGSLQYTVEIDGEPLDYVAALFYITEESLIRANPGIDRQPLQKGQVLSIPGAKYQIREADTFQSVADAFHLTLPDLTGFSQEDEGILAELSVWNIPPFTVTIREGDSLRSLAERYNLNLEELLDDGLSRQEDLFLRNTGLLVPQRPDMEGSQLVAEVMKKTAVNDIAASLSRFLLNGLRIPMPADEPDFRKLFSLYNLLGQQIDAPETSTTEYSLTLSNPDGVSWILPASTKYIFDGDDYDAIARCRQPFTPEFTPPAPVASFAYQPGRYALSQAVHWQNPAAGELAGEGDGGLSTAGEPVIYPFPSALLAGILDLSPRVPGQDGFKYDLVIGIQESPGVPLKVQPVESYCWATVMDFKIHRVYRPVNTLEAINNSYQLLGTDEQGRKTLQSIWEYMLSGPGKEDRAGLYILYSADPSQPNNQGCLSGLLQDNATFLLKTNLSTTSHSSPELKAGHYGPDTMDGAPLQEYYASTGDPQNFLKLLWECSVVNTGGYYLNYTEQGGGPLPGTIFNEAGEASLKLLVLFDSLKHLPGPAPHPDMLRFCNCAVICQNLDTSTAQLYVEASSYAIKNPDDSQPATLQNTALAMGFDSTLAMAEVNREVKLILKTGATITVNAASYVIKQGDTLDSVAEVLTGGSLDALVDTIKDTAGLLTLNALLQYQPGQLQLVNTIPTGSLGFELDRTNPDPDDTPYGQMTASQQMNLLFHLLGYQIQDTDYFSTVNKEGSEGLPAGPANAQGAGQQDKTLWNYKNSLQASNFARAEYNYAPAVPGLPLPQDNSYAGLAEGSNMTLSLYFQDVFGNRPDAAPASRVTLPFAYSDSVISVSMWPGIAVSYSVQKSSPPEFRLCLQAAVSLANYLSGPGRSLTASAKSVLTDREKLTQAYYQLIQPDLQVSVSASLDQPAENTPPEIHYIWKSRWFQLLSAQLIFLNALAELESVKIQAAAGNTLSGLCTPYLVSPGALAENNGALPADTLFDISETNPLVLPQKEVVRQGDTLITISERRGGTPGPVALAIQNSQAPLPPGTVIKTPQRQVPASAQEPTGDRSLADLWRDFNLWPLGLATENSDRADLLRQGAVVSLQGLSLQVPAEASFNQLVEQFMNYTVSVDTSLAQVAENYSMPLSSLADAIRSQAGIWREGAVFTYGGHSRTAALNDSLYDLAEAFSMDGLPVTVETLAQSNKDNATLLKTGAILSTGLFSIQLSDLVQANLEVKGLFVPGAVFRVSNYVTGKLDTLAGLESDPGFKAEDIAALNQYLPNLFGAGTPLFISMANYIPAPGETLSHLVAARNVTFEELGLANGSHPLKAQDRENLEVPGRQNLPDGRELMVPCVTAVNPDTGLTESLSDIAARFNNGLDSLGLARINWHMPYLFSPGQQVIAGGKTLTILETDNFNQLIHRFLELGVPLTDQDLVNALDKPGILAPGALFSATCPSISVIKPSGQALLFHVKTSYLLLVNRTRPGLLIPGTRVSLKLPQTGEMVSLDTRDSETLNTLLTNFQGTYGPDIGWDDLASAVENLDILIPGAAFILPPSACVLECSLEANLPGVLFPVDVTLAMERVQYEITGAVLGVLQAAGVPQQVIEILDTLKDQQFISGDSFRAKLRESLADAYSLLPLDLTLRISASPSTLVSAALEDTVPVQKALTTLSPYMPEGTDTSDAMSLTQFAIDFEDAFNDGENFLKLAVGLGREPNGVGEKAKKLWAVSFGQNGFEFSIKNEQVSYFAMRPLSNVLISRDARMSTYQRGQGLTSAPAMHFANVELDLWARQFLESVDLFLSGPYSVPAARYNPGAVARLLDCKEELSEAISFYLINLLESPGYAGDINKARDEFMDRLKIRLADAYSVETILQFPVDVPHSSFTDVRTAPRLSGKPVNIGFVTGATEDIETMAQKLNVSQQFLLDTISTMPGILNFSADGQVVRVQYTPPPGTPQTVELLPGMTLKSLAETTLGLENVYDLIGRLTVIEGDSLFAPHITVNITGVKGTVGDTGQPMPGVPARSFQAAAGYFDLPVSDLGRAIQNIPGIFAVASLSYNGRETAVTPVDTLGTVSARLDSTPETLAQYYAVEPGLLTQGISVYSLQVLPQYDISTAKVPLSEPGSHLTFFVDVKSGWWAKKMFFNLEYAINEIEFDISNVQNIEDYQASSWLSFVIPLGSEDTRLKVKSGLGQQEVPLLMRAYPPSPVLMSQEGEGKQVEAVWPDQNPPLDDLKSWEFEYSFEYRMAAQDEISTFVTFNDVIHGSDYAPMAGDGADPPLDLFEALAQFAFNYPQLRDDLELLPLTSGGSAPSQVAGTAIETFVQLAESVAQAWSAPDGRLTGDTGIIAETHEYILTTTHDQSPGHCLKTLIFHSGTASESLWPSHVWVWDDNDGKWLSLEPKAIEPDSREAVFEFPAGITPERSICYKAGFSGLNVIRYQSGGAGLSIFRNRYLVSSGVTAGPFVYTTPSVRFPNMFTPWIVRPEEYHLSAGTAQYSGNFFDSLLSGLSSFFIKLFDPENPAWNDTSTRQIDLAAGYSFALSLDQAEMVDIRTVTPVLLVTVYPFKIKEDYKTDEGSFVYNLATAISRWKDQNLSFQPSNPGFFLFDLKIYEYKTDGQPRPVLELSNLQYQFSNFLNKNDE